MFILKELFEHVYGGNFFLCHDLPKLKCYKMRHFRLNVVLNFIPLKFLGKITLSIKYKLLSHHQENVLTRKKGSNSSSEEHFIQVPLERTPPTYTVEVGQNEVWLMSQRG